jgi:hypothetical protein
MKMSMHSSADTAEKDVSYGLDRRRILLWISILALFAAALLLRLPFITNPLLGEEGSFARLVIGSATVASKIPRGYPEMLAGRIDGTEIFGPFQRNIVIYLVLDYPVRWLGNLLWPSGDTFDSVTVSARATYLLVFSCGVWVLGWAIMRFASRGSFFSLLAGFALAAYVLTSPLLVGASIQPQIDGSIGILFLGFCAFFLLKADLSRGATKFYVAAGLIAGLGRPEWLIAMVGAAVIAGFASFLFSDRITGRAIIDRPKLKLGPVLFCTGLAAGAIISIVISPNDYFAGFSVLTRVSATTGGNLAMVVPFKNFLIPLAILSAVTALMAFLTFLHGGKGRKASLTTGQLITLIGGIAIIVGFTLSGWSSDGFLRYFAPGMLLVAVSAIGLLSASIPLGWAKFRDLTVIAGCAIGLYFNATSLLDSYRRQVSISSYHGFSLKLARARMLQSAAISKSEHRIVLEFSALNLYYPEAEFVSRDWGLEGARQLIESVSPGRENSLYQPK